MKAVRPFLAFLILIVAYNSIYPARRLAEFTPINYKDNNDSLLHIDQAKIPAWKDTIFDRDKCWITHCPLTFTNNSHDTLKYMTMDVSWWDSYTLDNEHFALAEDWWNVFKNEITVRVLLPYQSVTVPIAIITYKEYYRGEKLRIAFSLQSPSPYGLMLKPKTTNMIWSNEVEMP